MTLPIFTIKDKIITHLKNNNRLILSAPTGSGKTTQVPQFILDSNILGEKTIIVLQPRRIATRMIAKRISQERHNILGQEIGFQTRYETTKSKNTKILFITEALLLRRLQTNPNLTGIGAIIIDEFHERHLASDVSLAMIANLQAIRTDLKLIVMSATLAIEQLIKYLNAKHISASGRSYPVTIKYQSPKQAHIWDEAAKCIKDCLNNKLKGDILVFMPGVYEIQRTIETCKNINLSEKVDLLPLYGQLPAREQDKIMQISTRRKVIISTNIAETSLTINGICIVIDSGIAKINRFDSMRQLNCLQTEEISRSSSEQRAGRAGRTQPGLCIRLWAEQNHQRRKAHEDSEINRIDLSSIFLQLLDCNINPSEFNWFEAPSIQSTQQAFKILQQLKAINHDNTITTLGSQMAKFPTHPRIARILIEGAKRNCGQRVAIWAAIASEQNLFVKNSSFLQNQELHSDFIRFEKALNLAQDCQYNINVCNQNGIKANICRQINSSAKLFCDIGSKFNLDMFLEGKIEDAIKSMLSAYPDFIAYRSSLGSRLCKLSDGKTGTLSKDSNIGDCQLILVGAIQEISSKHGNKKWLNLNSCIKQDWLLEIHPELFNIYNKTDWDNQTRSVKDFSGVTFNDLLIEEQIHETNNSQKATEILASKIINGELKLKNWNQEVDNWIERVRCCALWFPDKNLINYNSEDMQLILEEICNNAVRYKDIANKPCLDYIKHALSWDEICFVEKMAPVSIKLPNGKSLKIIYQAGKDPKGRAKIQELYDLNSTPYIGNGKICLQIEILAPNYRPCQITKDMSSFWKNTYPQVKKDLRGRYPKHEWR